MAANPQSFFRFAARYYPLLLDLFYRREGFTKADLRNLLEGFHTEGDPGQVTAGQPLKRLCGGSIRPAWKGEGTDWRRRAGP
jgi:hypothetical protein